jgi:C4-dicarboxylate transporter DctQ subunit
MMDTSNSLKEKGLFNQIIHLTFIVSAVMIVAMGALITYLVISRYLFHNPIGWVLEITEYMLLWSTFIGAAWVLKGDGHVKIDLVINFLPSRIKRQLESIMYVLGFLLFIYIAWHTSLETLDIYSRGILSVKMLKIPKYFLLMIIPLGSLLLSIQNLQLLGINISQEKTGSMSSII